MNKSIATLVTFISLSIYAQEKPANYEVKAHVVKSDELTMPELNSLHVPNGFRIERFATDVGNARILAIGPDGSLYVTRRNESDVLRYKIGSNGLAEGKPTKAASRAGIHGICFHQNKVYLATIHEIFTADVLKDGTFGPLTMLIHDLPDSGQHHTRTVQIGPDDMMYIGVGSTCNDCKDPNPENATILQASLDGKRRSIFASGLRDPIGWSWHPQTHELWGMDHGIDWLGDDLQAEELNQIEKGKNYGWPYLFGKNQANPRLAAPNGFTESDLKKNSVPMTMGYTAHSAPMQLSFYNAQQFPEEYKGDAFISMHGSWNRKPPSGYEVLRIKFKNGVPVKFEPFVTGFLTSKGETGRPVGNIIAPDGSLLFSDDRNGVIYRVSYEKKSKEINKNQNMIEPIKSMQESKSPLSKMLLKPRNDVRIQVTSTAYTAGSSIPQQYSAYDQNASIPLLWSKGPEGTKSYAVLMEDPDAKAPSLPVIHWIAWNIPVSLNALPEGLTHEEELLEPKGMRQGTNSNGKIGYTGPRPPEGDKPHRYYLQVFAMDVQLNLVRGATRDELITAMKDHVLALGELIGMFQRPEHPQKP